jgi:hypothetical protein
MLRVNSKERPTAAQLLTAPEVVSKIENSCSVMESQDSARSLLETIKVPQVLKKLNDVLPKPCYPDVENIAPTPQLEERSVSEPAKMKPQPAVEQRIANNNIANARPPNPPPSAVLQPCPPTGNRNNNNNVQRNHIHHRIW